jgi:predicted nucleic acid-binding protein
MSKRPERAVFDCVDLPLAANADLITSWDNHLVSLMDPASPAGKEFLSKFPRLRILTPVQLLKLFGALKPKN